MSETPISTPTSLPAAEAPKLRSSCENCGNSKVKCDRGQPTCSRCISLQLTCAYGVSLKHGKPPRKRPISCLDADNSFPARKRATGTSRTDQGCESHMTMGLDQSPSLNKAAQLDFSVPVTNVNPMSTDLNSAGRLQDGIDYTVRQSHDTNEAGQLKSLEPALETLAASSVTNPSSNICISSQHGSSFFNPFTIDEWPQFDMWVPILDFQPGSNSSRLPASTEPVNNHNASFDSPEAHSCPRGSYELFRDLICPSPFLHAPEANVTVSASLDEVLHFNSQAIDRLRQLLKCPCAKSGHRIMVHASIISRILIWYQQAAGWSGCSAWETRPSAVETSPPPGNESSSSQSSSEVDAASPPTLVQSTGFAVAQVPVSMGTFSVEDENMQDIFRNQLVLCELKKAANVIDLFTPQQLDECSANGVSGLYSHLGAWLRSEHLRTVRMLKARLSTLNKTLVDP